MKLATPVFVAMGLQSAYALIDLAWVGGLGDKAVAGLAISLQAFFIVLALAQVLATTALAELSQAYGAGRVADARRLFTSFTLVGVAVGAVAVLVAYASADLYVGTFTDDPEVHAGGVAYFEVTALTFLTQLVIMVLGNGLRASGDFVTPMRVMIVSVVANALLDPLFIFGWGPVPALGLSGAAWATVIAQLLALAIYARRLLGPRAGRELRWGAPIWPTGFFVRILSRGLPAGVQFFLMSAVLGIVLASVKAHGSAWTAAAGGGFRILQQGFLPLVALGSAAAACAGQNIGAGQPLRVREAAQVALRWGLLYAALMTVVLFFAGGLASHIFARGEGDLAVGAEYFRWSAPSLPAIALTYVSTFVLQAAGRAILPLLSALLRVAVLVALIQLALPALGLGPAWAFGAVTLTAYLEGFAAWGLLARFLHAIAGSARVGPAAAVAATPPAAASNG